MFGKDGSKMIVILCLDDKGGMMFHERRQSRDRVVVEDIVNMCQNGKLFMNEYSYNLFNHLNLDNVVISSTFLEEAEEGCFCFVENRKLLPFTKKIEKLIIYHWNRTYPGDFYLDIDFSTGWRLIEESEMVGNSHEKIVKEIYINEKKS